MKKGNFCSAVRFAALLLCLLLAGCGAAPAEEITAAQTDPVGTVVEATTEYFPETDVPAETEKDPEPKVEATEPVEISDVPGTDALAGPDVTPDQPEPLIPELSFSVLRSVMISEKIFDVSDEEDGEIATESGSLAERALAAAGFNLRERTVYDIHAVAKREINSGSADFDLMVFSCARSGGQLMSEGLLQNMASVGIDLTADSPYVNSSITSDLVYNGKTYLLAFDAFTSDLPATWLTAVSEFSEEATMLADAALAGGLTFDRFIEILNSVDDPAGYTVDSGDFMPMAVYRAFGGSVILPEAREDGSGAAPAILSGASLAAFDKAKSFIAGSDEYYEDRVIITQASLVPEEYVKLPLPALSDGSGYTSPVNANVINVASAPYGLREGNRLAAAMRILGEAASGLRDEEVHRYFGNSLGDGYRELASMICEAQTVDFGQVLTWGDLSETISGFIFDSDVQASSLAGMSQLSRALKAFAAAEAILFQKLK